MVIPTVSQSTEREVRNESKEGRRGREEGGGRREGGRREEGGVERRRE